VINSLTESDDITDSYYDTQTRLKTMELSLENYYTYLDKASTIDESLQVQNQINQLTVEIESLKGKLSLWDSLLAESLVTIRLRQANDPVKIKKEINWAALTFADMGYLMKSGLMQVVNVLVGVVQWLAIVLVAAAPIWIVGLIILLLVRRRIRKNRQKKAASPVQQQPPVQQPPQQQPPAQ
jgi:ACT domain-containing protein